MYMRNLLVKRFFTGSLGPQSNSSFPFLLLYKEIVLLYKTYASKQQPLNDQQRSSDMVEFGLYSQGIVGDIIGLGSGGTNGFIAGDIGHLSLVVCNRAFSDMSGIKQALYAFSGPIIAARGGLPLSARLLVTGESVVLLFAPENTIKRCADKLLEEDHIPSFLLIISHGENSLTGLKGSKSSLVLKRGANCKAMAPPKTVCVMDASGHLGSALVYHLLHRGYTVHAALQSHGDLSKPVEDFAFPSNTKNLKVFRSDLLDYHSIMDTLKGCSALFYCFEPPFDHPSYDEFMAEVEVRAAHNVLEACAQTELIEKVVFTSSATAVIWRDDLTSTSSSSACDLDERNWTDINFCKKLKLWHGLSKTLAEKTAWALAMDRGLNMVSINGGLLMGPQLTITNPYLKGAAEMYENGVLVTVDLKFIVDAHICVLEDTSAFGRYVCFDRAINCNQDALELTRLLLPASQSPTPLSLEDTAVNQQRISNKKLNKLMVHFDTSLQLH